jgi:hypothetical protein
MPLMNRTTAITLILFSIMMISTFYFGMYIATEKQKQTNYDCFKLGDSKNFNVSVFNFSKINKTTNFTEP